MCPENRLVAMHRLAESSADGMIEHDFTVGDVPGVLWSPASHPTDRAPLVLMGHGGGTLHLTPALVTEV